MDPKSVDPSGGDSLGRSFNLLNWTQFQGALNDNIFKLLTTFFLIRTLGSENAAKLSGLGGIIFALPFILFVPAAGVLADRYSKTRITVLAKIAEIAIMLAGAAMFWFGNPWLGFVVLFLMSTQSALFGPTKYGIIPELVKPHQLSRANGYLVSLTYLSIILGTVAAPELANRVAGPASTDNRGDLFALASLACVIIAITGTLTSLGIRRTPAMGSTASISPMFWNDVIRTFRGIRDDRFLVLAILGASYFSLIGGFMQLNLIPYSIEHLGLTETDGSKIFLYAAFGIGAGSLLAGRCSGRNIEFGIIPVGALLIALSTLFLFIFPNTVPMTRALMFTAGLGAGLYIIPLEAFIQFRAPKDKIGEVLAANGFLSWLGVLGAGILVLGLSFIPFWKPVHTFALLGALTLGMTLYCLKILPDFFARFAAMVLTRSVYRIRTTGAENLPVEGGALLVCNHVSYMDALIILAVQQRRIRFLMERSIYETHRFRRLFRLMGVIPISTDDPPRQLVASLQAAREQLDLGYLVCIFAEGALTRNGQLQGFKPGLEKILKGTKYPVIPMHLDGIWGSRFSHYHTMFFNEPAPLKWRYPVRLRIGQPMPHDSRAWQVYEAVRLLAGDTYDARKGTRRNMAYRFIRSARRHWRLPAISDTTGKDLTYGKTLIGAVLVAREIRSRTGGERMIGIALPPSVGGVLANLGVLLSGKVAINLNFTASPDAFASALEQAGVRVIITSAKLVEKTRNLPWPDNWIPVEDLFKHVGIVDKISAAIRAACVPTGVLAPKVEQGGDDLLTVMFSSGTTGVPKGVMLSHHNIISNAEAITEVFRPDRGAHFCAALPLFHSFGFTAGMYFPLIMGLRVTYHLSPLDTAKIVEVIRDRKCNTLFTTPSFLSSYMRKADPSELASLKFVVVGAEKLKQPLSDAFAEKFGVRPLEGYGTTEMSPVVSLNLPDLIQEPERQICSKAGSIGIPLPGITVRIADLDTGEPVPPGRAGMLLVKGPNRMLGYLGRDDLTAMAITDGWYRTGDVAKMDDDGFVYITDRLHRFSKIGGEMVPHLAVEEVLTTELKITDMSIAVTAIADEKKGERLVLLYTESAGQTEQIRAVIEQSSLPNLWRPSAAMMFKVEGLPMTATGKLDIRKLKDLAQERAGEAGRRE